MKDLLKSETHHLVLAALLGIFVVFDIKIPSAVAPFLNSILGKAFIILTALSLLAINPIVGVAAIIASFELLRRAGTGSEVITNSQPSNPMAQEPDEQPEKDLKITNIPMTLEENVINNMLPRVATDVLDDAPFKPTQNKLHGAGKL